MAGVCVNACAVLSGVHKPVADVNLDFSFQLLQSHLCARVGSLKACGNHIKGTIRTAANLIDSHFVRAGLLAPPSGHTFWCMSTKAAQSSFPYAQVCIHSAAGTVIVR